MKPAFQEDGYYSLEMTTDQADYMWFLDHCGFDQFARELRHTDIFFKMREILAGNNGGYLSQEEKLHGIFLLESTNLLDSEGHPATKRFMEQYWDKEFTRYEKSNFVARKLMDIQQGSESISPIKTLSLPDQVAKTGGKYASLLMLSFESIKLSGLMEWSQDLCLVDRLLEQRPNCDLLKSLQKKYHDKFPRLFLKCKKERSGSNGKELYDEIGKHPVPVRRDIVRCMLESYLDHRYYYSR